MPEEVNRVVADHLATLVLRPDADGRREPGRTRASSTACVEVGDLMQDLAARVAAEVRVARGPAGGRRGARGGRRDRLAEPLRPGGYLFATIHRAENREPAALAAWPRSSADAARPDRPVILALHPGTRAALERAGIVLPPGVRVVEPQGYRTSLTLQLHAAAVLTDSGGVQREAAWLGTPCLVLRATTEWVEAVAESGGRMVVVGLDRALVASALDRLAPGPPPRLSRTSECSDSTSRPPEPLDASPRRSRRTERRMARPPRGRAALGGPGSRSVGAARIVWDAQPRGTALSHATSSGWSIRYAPSPPVQLGGTP